MLAVKTQISSRIITLEHSQVTLANFPRVILQRTITILADPVFGAEVTTVASEQGDQIASPDSGFVQHYLAHFSRLHSSASSTTRAGHGMHMLIPLRQHASPFFQHCLALIALHAASRTGRFRIFPRFSAQMLYTNTQGAS